MSWPIARVGRWLAASPLILWIHLSLAGHAILFLAVYWGAFALRFDFDISADCRDLLWRTAAWVLPLKLVVFYVSGHCHGWWRYVTFADLVALLRATLGALVLIAAIDHFVLVDHIPRSVLLLDALLTILSLGVSRAGWRLFHVVFGSLWNTRNYRRALLVGPSQSAGLLAHQIHTHRESKYRIQGILSTKGGNRGARLGGIPILGAPRQVGEAASAAGVTYVLLIAGSMPGKELRGLMQSCDKHHLLLKIIPPVEDLFDGDRRVPVRNIEINDLLRREPVKLDDQTIVQLLKDRTVMVTGAGGSIGSEICRQAIRFKPRRLVLLGRGENRIFFIERELRAQGTRTVLHPVIADITDARRMRDVFQEVSPDVVFHAAAHKHVPLMEDNPREAIKNNVLGTRNVADLAHEYETDSFVFVSTDKAVRPANVMGATKQLAERYVMALSQESKTRFVATRFGNVLGSAGSVVPIFQEQIRRGGPITVTDPRMTRFFMTIPEASRLVLQAAAMGSGGEIFVLDMGEPVKIVELARDLIRLSGLPDNSIDISYCGIRPGEKLSEELYFEEEETLATPHPKLRVANHRPFSLAEISWSIAELTNSDASDPAAVRQRLRDVLDEYQPAQHDDQQDNRLPHVRS
jgi:FlaA1/EpsC-like NDP-sugar epimerase